MSEVKTRLVASATRRWTTSLWSDRWSAPALKARKGKIASRAFKRGFQQIAIADEERTFPWFDACARVVPPEQHRQAIRELADPAWPLYGGVDVARRTRPGSAVFVLANSPSGIRVPVEIRYGAWSPDRVAAEVMAVDDALRPVFFMVENNATQDAYLSLIRQVAAARGIGQVPALQAFTTGRNKADETAGLPGMAIELEHQQWEIVLPDHGPTCTLGGTGLPCAWCAWAEDMRSHPLAGSFDLGMAGWFAREAARAPGAYQTGPTVKVNLSKNQWYGR
jgi:hypothetical protein